ncbi:hypothetical protein ANCDUO_11166 [Ancylostoma duodenale]|uniref:Uncharacterized protein n=1 Tax=Ancylostoma duodenale TaxID=51022 RepID=A0A0C2GIA5_9BILA|nr:hypothetical protein ANCDUO_11166 [Ancylostoma duodenale]
MATISLRLTHSGVAAASPLSPLMKARSPPLISPPRAPPPTLITMAEIVPMNERKGRFYE